MVAQLGPPEIQWKGQPAFSRGFLPDRLTLRFIVWVLGGPRMRIWLITVGEPLPIDGPQTRLLRTGLFGQALARKGHEVTWWTSDFDHFQKKSRFNGYTEQVSEPRLTIKLLHSVAYRKNVSLARILNHQGIARQFEQKIRNEVLPDIIVCSMPTIELLEKAAQFAEDNSIPLLADIRDLWPDIFEAAVPHFARPFSRPVIATFQKRLRKALVRCTGIIGISEAYLNWALDIAQQETGPCDAVFPLGYQVPPEKGLSLNEEKVFLEQKGVNPAKMVCWFVGTFGSTYDLDTVIAAAKRLHFEGSEHVQFVLSGEGDSYLRLKEEAKSLSNVVFTGWLNRTQLAALASMSKVGLAAYAMGAPQSLPNKVFEYLAYGLPIVSSLPGECRALLENEKCGLSYSAGDADQLKETLDFLTAHPNQYQSMSENALKLFNERFRAETVYAGFETHLEKIVERADKNRFPGSKPEEIRTTPVIHD